jgi:hypothetical protein
MFWSTIAAMNPLTNPALNPFLASMGGAASSQQPGAAFFGKMMQESAERIDAFYKEAEKLEAQAAARAVEAADESAKLAKETVAYAQKLSAEWRKLSMEAMKKAAGGATA